MTTGSGATLQPTYNGHVATTQDALILFEACLSGQLSHVARRPHDRERNQLIKSGCVFIYEENASGIKRWTDGVTWSPSRILGNFLVYRELDKPFPPGEKKRAMKKNSRRPIRPGEPYSRPEGNAGGYSPTTPSEPPPSSYNGQPVDVSGRSLVGSLIDSYGFKPDGLVKKTMSVTVSGVTHHLVSYYNVDDVMHGLLKTPAEAEQLRGIRPRLELTAKQSFRSPLEEMEDPSNGQGDPSQMQYAYRPTVLGNQGYAVQATNPGYYNMPTAQYASASNHHPAPVGGYGVESSGMSHPYLPGTPQALHRQEEYGHFSQPPYRSYETLNNNIAPTSLPTTGASTVVPMPSTNTLPATERSHSLPQQSMMYHPPNIQPRPPATESPHPMDPRTSNSYSRSSYSLPGSLDVSQGQGMEQRRSAQPSPAQILGRRESQHVSPGYYSGERQQFYMNGAPPSMGHPHTHFPSGQPISPWANSPAGHQQI